MVEECLLLRSDEDAVMERRAAADDDVDEYFVLLPLDILFDRFEDEEWVLAAAPSLVLLVRNLCNLRDEFGSATSRDTTCRSLRRPLPLLDWGALDTTGLEISASGSIVFCLCFMCAIFLEASEMKIEDIYRRNA